MHVSGDNTVTNNNNGVNSAHGDKFVPLLGRKFSPYIDITHQLDNLLLLLHNNATSN
jgi:hypothetical protein